MADHRNVSDVALGIHNELKKLCPFSYARRKIEARRTRDSSSVYSGKRSHRSGDVTFASSESEITLSASLSSSPPFNEKLGSASYEFSQPTPPSNRSTKSSKSRSSSSTQFSQKFFFVDANDDQPKTKKDIRLHCMRESARKSRWRTVQRFKDKLDNRDAPSEFSSSNGSDEHNSLPSRKSRVPSMRTESSIGSPQHSSAASSDSILSSKLEPQMVMVEDAYIDSNTQVPLTDSYLQNPSTILHPNVVDPFAQFPVQLDHDAQLLVHYYVAIMPTFMYRFQNQETFNPQRDVIFRFGLTDPAALHAILSHAASSRAQQDTGPIIESKQAIRHKATTLSLINESFKSASPELSEGTFFAILHLLILEHNFGSRDAMWVHYKGFQQLLRAKGGLRSINNPDLMMTVAWDLIATGSEQATCFNGCAKAPIAPADSFHSDISDMKRCGTELIAFFSNLRHLENYFQSSDDEFDDTSRPLFSKIRQMFGVRSQVHRLLRTPFLYDYPSGRHLPVQTSCQMASLLYLSKGIMDCCRDGLYESCHTFLERLEARMCETEDDPRRSIVGFMWNLLRDMPVAPELMWSIVRMMKAIERLSFGLHEMVKNKLLVLLEADTSLHGPLFSVQEIGDIKHEIFADLSEQ